jgi:rRNA-processing protein EBP2
MAPPKSRLRQALAAEKNVDFQKLKEKKKAKASGKTTAASHNEAPLSDQEEDDWTDEHDSDGDPADRQAMQVSERSK